MTEVISAVPDASWPQEFRCLSYFFFVIRSTRRAILIHLRKSDSTQHEVERGVSKSKSLRIAVKVALVIAVGRPLLRLCCWQPAIAIYTMSRASVVCTKKRCNVATSSKVACLSSVEIEWRSKRLRRQRRLVLIFSRRNSGQATVPKQLAEGVLQAAVLGSAQQCAVRHGHCVRELSEHLVPT